MLMRWNGAGLATLVMLGFAGTGASEPQTTDFSWISGHWCGTSNDVRIEEYWLPPHGGVVLGVARTLKGDETVEFEYTRIVLMQDKVPAFIAQPEGGAPTSFVRTAGGANWARFENPEHDYPKRVEYRREGDKLHGEISGPGEDGQEQTIPFDYVRCP